jgi:hypothetical protein
MGAKAMLKRRPKPGKPELVVARPTDDAKSWKAYSELESDVLDLQRMALLAAHHFEEDDQWLDREAYEDMRAFLVYDVAHRAEDLRKKYLEGFGDSAVQS